MAEDILEAEGFEVPPMPEIPSEVLSKEKPILRVVRLNSTLHWEQQLRFVLHASFFR